MNQVIKVRLVLNPQPEDGFTVTSPILPELVTEGENLEDVYENVQDAIAATLELYQDMGKPLPANLVQDSGQQPIWFECLVSAP